MRRCHAGAGREQLKNRILFLPDCCPHLETDFGCVIRLRCAFVSPPPKACGSDNERDMFNDLLHACQVQ